MADFAGAMKAMEDHLKSLWTETEIAFEDDDAPVGVDENNFAKSWVLFDIVATEASIRSVGEAGKRVTVDRGFIELTHFSRRGGDRNARREQAARLQEVFRTVVLYAVGEGVYLRTWTPTMGPGNPAKSQNPSGSWWAIEIRTPFEFYHRA